MDNLLLNKVKIVLTFMSLALLACGLPTFVLQAVTYYHISYSSAGSLEAYMNIARIIGSFVIFAFLLKLGYKKSMIYLYLFLTGFCLLVPFFDSIWTIRTFLIVVGLSIVVIKIITYSSVGLVTKNPKEHAMFINLLEAVFMGIWLYSTFLKLMANNWIYIFWCFAFYMFLMLILWFCSNFDESLIKTEEEKPIHLQYKGIFEIFGVTLVLFVIFFATYEVYENGIGTWLPNFNHDILQIPKYISVQVASFMTLSIAFGRLFGILLLKYMKWYVMFIINITTAGILLALILLNVQHGEAAGIQNLFQAPLVAYGIPAIGFFLGPIYPTLTSTVLSSIPKTKHAIMMSLLMILASIFGAAGSKMLGVMFGIFGGIEAFSVMISLTLVIMFCLTIPYYLLIKKKTAI